MRIIVLYALLDLMKSLLPMPLCFIAIVPVILLEVLFSSALADDNLSSFTTTYCVECHGVTEPSGGLDLESLSTVIDPQNSGKWENISRRLLARQMPPQGALRPEEKTYIETLANLNAALDAFVDNHPMPGRSPSLRRLNRTEYQNAIRDIFNLEIDATALLPPDESSHGFDNITVSDLSPSRMVRYVSAAQKISRLAYGIRSETPSGDTFRTPADLTQDVPIEGLPLGTRGGLLIPYTFQTSGTYEIEVRLARDRNEEIEGLHRPHDMDVLLDGKLIKRLRIVPPKENNDALVDANLRVRFETPSGFHRIGVTFVKLPTIVMETLRQPHEAHFNMHRHPRLGPAVYQVSITGPYAAASPASDSANDKVSPATRRAMAVEKIKTLTRMAYRRDVSAEDVDVPMSFFDDAFAISKNDDQGMQAAVSAILVNPNFLFRVERDPIGIPANTAYRISDWELASRLSFMIWSSVPDAELLELAQQGRLSDDGILASQVQRMLDDVKSKSLVTNFADQWLYLRNLNSITPDLRLFPDFDENLRRAMHQETSLFVESVFKEDRSVLDLINANYSFLNERLAKHYGVPNVYGQRFRRVALDEDSHRGGLLRHGSILTVTSYATRTSPVIRGHWVLKNLLGMAPPPPPPNVPTLPDVTVNGNLSVRERLAEHRANSACAACHDSMDPVGFSLENFDAVGRWRDFDEGAMIDSKGRLPDGSECDGVSGLEFGLINRIPEVFISTFVERLLTFALGRGIEPEDGAAIRAIVGAARAKEYRFSSIVLAVARSKPFQMRMSQ